MRKTYVWDLPTRLFHWSLALLVAFQWASAEVGGFLMDYHVLGGYAILALVLFRVVWGLVGSHHARFANFLRGVGPTLEYARALRANAAPRYLGHNPLGGWMVLALLGMLALQIATGLFASDDAMTRGPLMHLVSEQASQILTQIHEGSFGVLLALIVLHVASVMAHRIFKGENLARAMVTGYKEEE